MLVSQRALQSTSPGPIIPQYSPNAELGLSIHLFLLTLLIGRRAICGHCRGELDVEGGLLTSSPGDHMMVPRCSHKIMAKKG